MKNTADVRTGTGWEIFGSLEGLEFAGDIHLITTTKPHMQEKTANLSGASKKAGLQKH